MTEAVVVGSGPNGLAAAITLAAEGISVLVLEAAGVPGGGTRSSELTLPGLLHDECSAAHPLALDTPFARRFDLRRHGLQWLWPEVQYAHPLDGGDGAAAYMSVDATTRGLGPGGERWRSLFGPLAARFDQIAGDFMRPMLHVPDHPVALGMLGVRSAPPVSVAARWLGSERSRALFAGVAAHAFRPFSAPMSSAIGITLGTAAHACGWPVAAGGSAAISRAMVALLEELGGRVQTGVRVESLAELGAPEIVMLDLDPASAVRLAGTRMPGRIARSLSAFRYGPGAFKVDFAVAGGVPWRHEPSRRAGTVHLGGNLREIAHAERETHRGRLAQRPFVLVCQQYLADPRRSHGDIHPVYSYAHVPAGFDGDATELIEAQIERFAPGFRERVQARYVRSTTEMARYNTNYVGGDIATGANGARQLVFRPRPALDPYSLGIPGVFLCSAATPPGAGAHGMCGYNAALSALRAIGHQPALPAGDPLPALAA